MQAYPPSPMLLLLLEDIRQHLDLRLEDGDLVVEWRAERAEALGTLAHPHRGREGDACALVETDLAELSVRVGEEA